MMRNLKGLPLHSPFPQVFGFCCTCTGRPALVMELIKCPAGDSLDLTRWARVRSMDRSRETNRQRVSIACGVAAGMAFLHDRGYIHADLKPGNVRIAHYVCDLSASTAAWGHTSHVPP